MRTTKSISRLVPLLLLTALLLLVSVSFDNSQIIQTTTTQAQTRERSVRTPPSTSSTNLEVIKTDVDLVTVDALVLQKKTSRVVGDLTRDDFIISEDGKPQNVTHFSQGSLPLSVLLMIDRGGCLDPFNPQVRHAASDALARLKPTDEVADLSQQRRVVAAVHARPLADQLCARSYPSAR
jgi:hypothetical protein